MADTLQGKIDRKGTRFYIQVDEKQIEIRFSPRSEKLPGLFMEASEKNNIVALTGDLGKEGVFYCKKFRTVQRGPKLDQPPVEKK
jgi:hypothetical protein